VRADEEQGVEEEAGRNPVDVRGGKERKRKREGVELESKMRGRV